LTDLNVPAYIFHAYN